MGKLKQIQTRAIADIVLIEFVLSDDPRIFLEIFKNSIIKGIVLPNKSVPLKKKVSILLHF